MTEPIEMIDSQNRGKTAASVRKIKIICFCFSRVTCRVAKTVKKLILDSFSCHTPRRHDKTKISLFRILIMLVDTLNNFAEHVDKKQKPGRGFFSQTDLPLNKAYFTQTEKNSVHFNCSISYVFWIILPKLVYTNKKQN